MRPLILTQNDVRNFGQKHDLQYLEKISCVKSGFQILYAVEKFRQIKARSTHIPNP